MNRDEKLTKLREHMDTENISAVIIPSTDPHSSEYVHEHWKIREWFSNFSGSAGTLVVTKDESALWTDFRYFIQAENELSGSEIKLYKDGLATTPSIAEYLNEKLKKGDKIGIDGSLFQTSFFEKIRRELSSLEIEFDRNFNSVEDLWLDRPAAPDSKAYDFSIQYNGETRESKIQRVRDIMKSKKIDSYIISSLADIAWVLNLRGSDVTFTPLLISYLIITANEVKLFIESEKVSKELEDSLKSSGIDCYEYSLIADHVKTLQRNSILYYMPESLNCYLSGLVPKSVKVIHGLDITADLKCIKNDTEIKNIRVAMEKDGAALVKFYKKFNELRENEQFTEYTLAPLLRDSRLSMDGCVDESFGPIIGYESNGALCHYSAEEDSAKIIGDTGLLLIDSGGQYYQGTTDITRTIALSKPTVEEIEHYTLVLKGHIRLSMAKFPEGTSGGQLDILAREVLWNNDLDYGHGTGHGVGFFLGVHEGPQNISSRGWKSPLKPGMVTSNEPGLYIEGKHGIRIENLVLTKVLSEAHGQKFLGFETLTLYPYDINLIDKELLTKDEINWVNSYHKEVTRRISKYLDKNEIKWLEEITCEI